MTEKKYHKNHHKKHPTPKFGRLALIGGATILSGTAVNFLNKHLMWTTLGALLVNSGKNDKDDENSSTKVFSLRELAEMCARGRIVVAYQV